MTNLPQLSVMLERVRSAYNVGSVFRTCDSAGVDKLYLTGYTATPPHHKLEKTALGSMQSVNWEHHCHAVSLAQYLRSQGMQIIALEPTKTSVSIYSQESSMTTPVCLIFGNEVAGITPELLKLSDQILHIPQLGIKSSLNVASAAAIAIYEASRQLHRL